MKKTRFGNRSCDTVCNRSVSIQTFLKIPPIKIKSYLVGTHFKLQYSFVPTMEDSEKQQNMLKIHMTEIGQLLMKSEDEKKFPFCLLLAARQMGN